MQSDPTGPGPVRRLWRLWLALGRLLRRRLRLGRQYRRWRLLRGIERLRDARKREDHDRLVELIRRSGTDDTGVFGETYAFEGGLYLQQNADEFAALLARLKEHSPIGTYVEIGSASGGQCLLLHREVGFGRGLTLDDGRHRRAPEQAANFAKIPNLDTFTGDSHSSGARDFLAGRLNGGAIDVAFIDGDHSYAGVAQDVRLVLEFSRPGTLLIFHDTVASEGVERAWLECVRSKVAEPLAEYVGSRWPMGIGVAAVVAGAERR